MRISERSSRSGWRLGLIGSSVFVLCVIGASAQSPVKNPSLIAFQCPDHDRDDAHEIDIVRASDGAVIQTLAGGDPPLTAQGEVEVAVNVQPVGFGQYRFVVRAVAGGLKSENSLPSAIWERGPGKPTNLVVR